MSLILLVDDDEALLDALLRHFRGVDGWQVQTARNGAVALRVASEHPPDVLVTDVLMPEKDGIETIVEFQRAHPAVKIIAMSGGGVVVGKEPLDWARRLGADAALEKPFGFDVLRDTIRGLLQ